MSLGVILLIAFVALVAIMVGSSVYFTWLMNKMVYSQLQELDIIRTTGQPPEKWQKAMIKKGIKRGGISDADRARQLKKDLRRMDGIVRFARKTTMVEDEDTRKLVLAELEAIRKSWIDEQA